MSIRNTEAGFPTRFKLLVRSLATYREIYRKTTV